MNLCQNTIELGQEASRPFSWHSQLCLMIWLVTALSLRTCDPSFSYDPSVEKHSPRPIWYSASLIMFSFPGRNVEHVNQYHLHTHKETNTES